jgi:DnaJ-class molecular chaperone
MNDKTPIPCEHCSGTGIKAGNPCRECRGKGYRLLAGGKSRATPRGQDRLAGRRARRNN